MKRMHSLTYGLLTLCITSALSCSPQMKDRAIKEDITTKAKDDINFAGMNYTVENGVVSLSGYAPTADAREKAASTIKRIAGVKQVNNMVAIAPVVLDHDFPLKQSVDSVLMKYSKAQAHVEEGHVVILGKASKEEADKLLKALDKLPISSVDNQLVIN